jgi:uncharacterized Zn finger protein (UPF0148 family)
MSEEKKVNSFLDKLKNKATTQKMYGGEYKKEEAGMDATTCPNCGAGRAKQDGLTHCGYCGHEFISVTLTDTTYIKKEDNSRK